MADSQHSASVRLGLNADGFRTGLASASRDVESFGTQSLRTVGNVAKHVGMGTAFAVKETLVAAKRDLTSLGQSMLQITGIGGAIGLASVAREFMNTERSVGRLQSAVRLGTGEFLSYDRAIKAAGKATSGPNASLQTDDMIRGMSKMFSGSGSFEFAEKSIQDVATTAMATGEPVEKLSGLVADLNEKFGIEAGAPMQQSMQSFFELVNKGGIEVDEAINYMGQFGAAAKAAGLEGEDGMKSLFGFVNSISDGMGGTRKALTATQQITQGLETGSFDKKAKQLLNLDLKGMRGKGMKFDEMLGGIVERAGGDEKKIEGVFGKGPAYQAMMELSKLGKTSKEVTEALRDASKTAMTFDQGLGQLAKTNSKQAAAQFDAAINSLKASITTSPALAQALGRTASFVTDTAAPLVAKGTNAALDFAEGDGALWKAGAGYAAYRGMPALGKYALGAMGAAPAAGFAISAASMGIEGNRLLNQKVGQSGNAEDSMDRLQRVLDIANLVTNTLPVGAAINAAGGYKRGADQDERREKKALRARYNMPEDDALFEEQLAWDEAAAFEVGGARSGKSIEGVGVFEDAKRLGTSDAPKEDEALRFLSDSVTTTKGPAAEKIEKVAREMRVALAPDSSVKVNGQVQVSIVNFSEMPKGLW